MSRKPTKILKGQKIRETHEIREKSPNGHEFL